MINSSIVKIGTHSNRYGESGTDYYLVPKFDQDGENQFARKGSFKEFINENFPRRSCNCTHDCCGHVFAEAGAVIAYDRIRQNFIVAQSWGQNI